MLRGAAKSPASEAGLAEESFRRALALAHQQETRSLELRAAMSLARLEATSGQAIEAKQRLAEICDSFTEGFATPDLQEAFALLGREE
jgi:ATP/maltotriose-dependent transcriptional regulator MalT